ncbi:hypothetical protein P879_07309 [Paragonimus westermani]|uniref:Uncharacterized protein n=1 Tax=Paragonimus westermani TaxID=34504 RepID=A0A8T0DAV7_9TREM|nr:hypothetical protein P879_07309 [Paragonimus westermani]
MLVCSEISRTRLGGSDERLIHLLSPTETKAVEHDMFEHNHIHRDPGTVITLCIRSFAKPREQIVANVFHYDEQTRVLDHISAEQPTEPVQVDADVRMFTERIQLMDNHECHIRIHVFRFEVHVMDRAILLLTCKHGERDLRIIDDLVNNWIVHGNKSVQLRWVHMHSPGIRLVNSSIRLARQGRVDIYKLCTSFLSAKLHANDRYSSAKSSKEEGIIPPAIFNEYIRSTSKELLENFLHTGQQSLRAVDFHRFGSQKRWMERNAEISSKTSGGQPGYIYCQHALVPDMPQSRDIQLILTADSKNISVAPKRLPVTRLMSIIPPVCITQEKLGHGYDRLIANCALQINTSNLDEVDLRRDTSPPAIHNRLSIKIKHNPLVKIFHSLIFSHTAEIFVLKQWFLDSSTAGSLDKPDRQKTTPEAIVSESTSEEPSPIIFEEGGGLEAGLFRNEEIKCG